MIKDLKLPWKQENNKVISNAPNLRRGLFATSLGLKMNY